MGWKKIISAQKIGNLEKPDAQKDSGIFFSRCWKIFGQFWKFQAAYKDYKGLKFSFLPKIFGHSGKILMLQTCGHLGCPKYSRT